MTAYQAERSITPGLRILIHPHVMRHNIEPFLNVYTIPLPKEESNGSSTHELRLWRAAEAESAISKLRAFRDVSNVPERAVRHYDAAMAAYDRFRSIKKELPHVLPATWLWRDSSPPRSTGVVGSRE